MVKLEIGKAYMTGTKHVALVYKHDPDQFPAYSRYSEHTYSALLLSISAETGMQPETYMQTFTKEGRCAAVSSDTDIVRDATFAELDEYISKNKSQLSEPTNNKYLENFYEAWKKYNP